MCTEWEIEPTWRQSGSALQQHRRLAGGITGSHIAAHASAAETSAELGKVYSDNERFETSFNDQSFLLVNVHASR